MMRALYLGIDIGGTASRWTLVDAQGKAVANGAAGGATGHVFNPTESHKLSGVLAEIAATCAEYGGAAGISLGVTGLGAAAHDAFKTIVHNAFGSSAVQLSDDMELAFRAAFAPGAGHLVSAGTGSIGLHIRADGQIIRVGGRGLLIDDGGSGTWIALQALDQIYRRIDRTGRPDGTEVLADELFTAIGGTDWDATRAYVYGSDRGRIGALAQAVARAAERKDPLALEILDRAGQELARLGLALVARAGECPIGYIGGVLGLHPAIKAGLLAALSGHSVIFPTINASLHAAQQAQSASSSKD